MSATAPLANKPYASDTLGALFAARVRDTPERCAYLVYDAESHTWQELSWQDTSDRLSLWCAALAAEGLAPGDRVGLMLHNRLEWILFEQAATSLGLVTVPIFAEDRGGNVAYICRDAGVRVLLIEGSQQWHGLQPELPELPELKRIVHIDPLPRAQDARLVPVADWLPSSAPPHAPLPGDANGLATIVYTSGTTGNPKGVMLSHRNILSNIQAATQILRVTPDDRFLSFLPLSHMLERTGGYYLPMLTGASVAFCRSIPQLAEDLESVRPTCLISVPRIYERVYARMQEGLRDGSALKRLLFKLAVDAGWHHFERRQGRAGWRVSELFRPFLDRLVGAKLRARLGGRLRAAISGGAPLSPEIARVFIGLGVPILQGYGLTESSPLLTGNRPEDNLPASIGTAAPDTELKLGADGELLARGPQIMLGFWNNEEETRRVIDADGWLHTGDVARCDESGHYFITGRIKEIIVMANGEKVSPSDMEMAFATDPLFDQAMVIGEGRSYLAVLGVVNPDEWRELCATLAIDPTADGSLADPRAEAVALDRIGTHLHHFPGYAKVRKVTLMRDPWTIENGLLTPTLKMKRAKILAHFAKEVAAMYSGH